MVFVGPIGPRSGLALGRLAVVSPMDSIAEGWMACRFQKSLQISEYGVVIVSIKRSGRQKMRAARFQKIFQGNAETNPLVVRL